MPESDRKHRNRQAFAFYATNDQYAIAVMVFVHRLRRIGLSKTADVVVLHLPLSSGVVIKMQQMGIKTCLTSDIPCAYGQYYRYCLLKLKIFGLTCYDTIIYVDADAIPLKSLDFLFTCRLNGPIGAPRAYWLPQPFWGSYLMLIKPSAELWDRVRRHFALASKKPYYDMDIINAEFGSEIEPLPQELICLNSEWEDVNRPGFFGEPADTYSRISVVHFTALGKPWSYPLGTTHFFRPKAHPIFHELFALWWSVRNEIDVYPSAKHRWIKHILIKWNLDSD